MRGRHCWWVWFFGVRASSLPWRGRGVFSVGDGSVGRESGRWGGRALFMGVGLASVLWLLPWVYSVPNDSVRQEQQQAGGPGMLEILSRRETWGTSLGMFALGYVWIFLLTWLPSYLVKERGYSVEQMAVFGSLPFWGMAIASLTGGWASDRRIARGSTATRVRQPFAVAGLLLCAALMLPAAPMSNRSLALGFLIASCTSLGIFTSNVWAITQTLAGPGRSERGGEGKGGGFRWGPII